MPKIVKIGSSQSYNQLTESTLGGTVAGRAILEPSLCCLDISICLANPLAELRVSDSRGCRS